MVYELIKRNRYFDPSGSGFSFNHDGENHYQDFKTYHGATARMHNASLYDWGIARGLEVTKVDETTIKINSGVAIDGNGELIVLSEEGKGDIGSDPPNDDHTDVSVPVILDISNHAGETYYVTIQFSEILRTGEGAGGRFEQVPWIRLQPVAGEGAYEDNGTSIILAIVVVDAMGKLAELKGKDPGLSFRRRLIGEQIGELQFRDSQLIQEQVKEEIGGRIAAQNGNFQFTVPKSENTVIFSQYDKETNTFSNFSNFQIQANTINLNGQLGIGTQTPLNSLHISRDSHLNVIFENSAHNEHLTAVVGSNGSGLRFSNSNFFFIGAQPFEERNDGSAGTELLRITNEGNFTANILGKPALQLSAPEQKQTYLTLLNTYGQQSIQLDTTTGAGSIRIKNTDDKGIGAFQASDNGAGLFRLYNKTGERTMIELFADQGESGVMKLFGADGSEKLQLSESGIGTAGTVIADNISSRGSLSSSSISTSSISASNISASSIFADSFGTIKTNGWITKTFADNKPAVQVALVQGDKAGWLGLFNSNGQRNATLIGDGRLFLGGEGANGFLQTSFANNKPAIRASLVQGDKAGWLGLFNSNGQRNATLIGDGRIFCKKLFSDEFGTIKTNGWITKTFADNKPAVQVALVQGDKAGWLGLFNSNGQRNATLIGDGRLYLGSQGSYGLVSIKNSAGKEVVYIGTTVNNDGSISVNDAQGNQKLYLQGNGAKNFVTPHPFDDTKNIIYACIEGPEAAAYIRGKSKLVNGQAEIEFPEHFSLVVNPETITIQLTPRSAESKGLAVVSQSEHGFSVRELWQGEGNYEFDYFVAGVRQGMENFSPVVDKGLTAFGEPMGEVVSPSSVAPQPVSQPTSIMEEIVSSTSAELVDSLSSSVAEESRINEEMVPSPSAEPVESLSSPAPEESSINETADAAPEIQPQATILEEMMPEVSIPTISSIPSPPAINFADKRP